MMKFIYKGQYPDGNTITQSGVVFEAGIASDVADADLIEMLRGNRFFEAVGASAEAMTEVGDGDADTVGPGKGDAAGPGSARRARRGNG